MTIRLTDIKVPRVDLVRLPANNAPAPQGGREAGESISADLRKSMDSATSNKAISVLEQLRQLLQGTPGGNTLVAELSSYIDELGDEVQQASQDKQQAQVDVAAASAKQTGQTSGAKPSPAKTASVKKAADIHGPCKSCNGAGPVTVTGLCMKCDSVEGSFKKSTNPTIAGSSGAATSGPMAAQVKLVPNTGTGFPPNNGGIRRQGPYIFPISASALPVSIRKAAALIVKEAVRSGQHDLFTAETVDSAYEYLAEEQWTSKNHPINKATSTLERSITKQSMPGTIPIAQPLAPNPLSGGASTPGGSISGPSDGGFGRPMGQEDITTPIMNTAEGKPEAKSTPRLKGDYNGENKDNGQDQDYMAAGETSLVMSDETKVNEAVYTPPSLHYSEATWKP